jgi:hypothetical protein
MDFVSIVGQRQIDYNTSCLAAHAGENVILPIKKDRFKGGLFIGFLIGKNAYLPVIST